MPGLCWVLVTEQMNPDLQELRTEQEKIVPRHRASIVGSTEDQKAKEDKAVGENHSGALSLVFPVSLMRLILLSTISSNN